MRLAVVVLIAALVAAAAEPSGFTVAALRRDGVLIPFAGYDGKRWSARWTMPERDPEIPINLRSVPSRWWGPAGPQETWTAWIDNHAGPTLRVLRPEAIDVHCVRQVGLRTDYRPSQPAPPSDEQPYPKDGLAVAPPQTVEAIEIIDTRAPQLDGLMPVLREAFDRGESATAESFNHPVPSKTREAIAPQIEAVYAFSQAPRVYYVESQRTYGLGYALHSWPFRDSSDCGTAFGSGWFARDEKGFRSLDPDRRMSVRIVPCDKYGASYMLPFGAMRLGTKTYWIVQFSGWDHERYVVLDIGPKTVDAVINVWGGGC